MYKAKTHKYTGTTKKKKIRNYNFEISRFCYILYYNLGSFLFVLSSSSLDCRKKNQKILNFETINVFYKRLDKFIHKDKIRHESNNNVRSFARIATPLMLSQTSLSFKNGSQRAYVYSVKN